MTLDVTWPCPYCPIERGTHPQVAVVQRRAFEWMDRFSLFGDEIPRESAMATDSARVCGGMIPHAPEDLLLLMVTYFYWGFMIDNLFDIGSLEQRTRNYRSLAPQILRILECRAGPRPDEPPIIALFRDIRRNLAEHATPAQVRLWSQGHYAYLLGVGLEQDGVARKALPDADDYLFLRTFSTGLHPTLTSIEICGRGEELPARERESTTVIALTQIATVLIFLYGDAFSYGKEGDWDYNMINVLANDNGCSREQARLDTVALCDRIMILFLRLRERTAPRVSQETRHYLEDLGTSIAAVLDVVQSLPRYRDGGLHSVPADHPSDGSVTPPPYPNIAWWWDI